MKHFAILLVLLLPACTSGTSSSSVETTHRRTTTTIHSTNTTSPTTLVPGADTPYLPDQQWTPGVLNPNVSQSNIQQTICKSGWTSTIRPPVSYTDSIKRFEDNSGGTVSYQGVSYPVHGFNLTDKNISHFELDHETPLELGGSPASPSNLWLQPYEPPKGSGTPGRGSQTKDQVENATKSAVCAGRMTLADAQHGIQTDWVQLGRTLGVVR